MSQFLRSRVVSRLIRTASRSRGSISTTTTTSSSSSSSVTARRGNKPETSHHLITPKEHRQHQNIHTTAYLRGPVTAASHRHLPSIAGGHLDHPTPTIAISTSPAAARTMATSSSQHQQPLDEDKDQERQPGSPKENKNPALPSSTPPSPRSAQEIQVAAANESGPQPETAQEQPEGQAGQSHPHALPAPPPRESDAAAAGEGEAGNTRLEVGGEGVRLDHLGPLVVHQDGTVSRIANWAEMTDIERKNTLRILGKRNQLRLETLRGKDGESSNGGDGRQQAP